jgi:hypothetical protein
MLIASCGTEPENDFIKTYTLFGVLGVHNINLNKNKEESLNECLGNCHENGNGR